jgi:hypothetical protein
MSKYLVVLSDLHIGGTTAVWPKGFITQQGNEISLNPLQEWLWDCWQDGIKWVKKVTKNDYILALNGDLVEGIHHKAYEVMTPSMDDHVSAAIQLLKPLARNASKVVCTIGTEAHSKNSEHAIASVLGALQHKPYAPAYNSITVRVNTIDIELMHHIATATNPWTEGTGHSAALNSRRAELSRLGRLAPRVLIRGHRHRFGYFCDGAGMTVVTPSWQGLTRWAWKVLPGAEVSVGFTVIDCTELEDGKIPRVRFRLYSPEAEDAIDC